MLLCEVNVKRKKEEIVERSGNGPKDNAEIMRQGKLNKSPRVWCFVRKIPTSVEPAKSLLWICTQLTLIHLESRSSQLVMRFFLPPHSTTACHIAHLAVLIHLLTLEENN